MLLTLIILVLFSNALTMRKDATLYNARICIIGLISSFVTWYTNYYMFILNKGVSLYGGLFNITSVTQMFTMFLILISTIILIYNGFFHRRFLKFTNFVSSKDTFTYIRPSSLYINPGLLLGDNLLNVYRLIEYPLIILFVVLGGSFLMCSGDLIALFISIEIQSYALYILSSINRDSEQSTWGGLTYFLLGGLSSCFILLGSGFLYVNSGTTSIQSIYIISAIAESLKDNYIDSFWMDIYNSYYIDISLIMISVGLLFKLGGAPFHFWTPDVYDALPTAVTTYVSITAKISIFILLLDLAYYININELTVSWKNTLLISSVLSLIIGSILGIRQLRIKKLLAYSTINNIGFILLALCVDSSESIMGYLFYIISYTISSLNGFIILVTIGYILYLYIIPLKKYQEMLKSIVLPKSFIPDMSLANRLQNIKLLNKKPVTDLLLCDNKLVSVIDIWNLNQKSNTETTNDLKDMFNSPVQLISQLKGFFYINTYLCLSLSITLFSFIGIPPLIGFFAKQIVLSAALDKGFIFISLIAILTSVIGAVYYLNIVKNMFFFKPEGFNTFMDTKLQQRKYITVDDGNVLRFGYGNWVYGYDIFSISSPLSLVISILTLVLALFLLLQNEFMFLVKIQSLLLFN